MISLYYIPGVSKNDTLGMFPNIQTQAQFFNGYIKYTTDGYFPPRYTDSVPLDVPLDIKANYLSIEYNSKVYYYFINRVEYNSRGLTVFNIEMDVLQTNMFNVKYLYSEVTRRTINRWNEDGTINRNYIRENISEGVFKNAEYRNLSKEQRENEHFSGYYIVESTEMISGTENMNEAPMILNYKNLKLCYKSYFFAIPKVIFNDVDYVRFNGWSAPDSITGEQNVYAVNVDYEDFCYLLRYLSEKPNTVRIYDCNVDVIDNIAHHYYVREDGKRILEFDSDRNVYLYSFMDISATPNRRTFFNLAKPTIRDLEYDLNIGFFFDTVSPLYDRKNDLFRNPVILDENYLRINYGERMGVTSFPSYKLSLPKVKLVGTLDLSTGYRFYKILDYKETELNEDIYFTTKYNRTIQNLALYNDAWKTYLSQNEATLSRGVALQKGEAVFQAIGGFIAGMGTFAMGHPIAGVGMMVGSTANLAFNNYKINESVAITQQNLEYTPDRETQGNAFSTDVFSEAIDTIYTIELVSDYEKIIHTFEYYGYKVDEFYNNVDLLNDEKVNSRIYYNIIACKNLDVVISDSNLTGIIDLEMIDKIKERFTDGVRVWNYQYFDKRDEIFSENLDNTERFLIPKESEEIVNE